MRGPLLFAAASALIAAAGLAQEAEPAAEPPAETKSEPEAAPPGLQDLNETLRTLEDAPPAEAEPVAEPAPEPPAEPVAEPEAPAAEPAAVPAVPSRLPNMPPAPLTRAQRGELAAAVVRGRLLGAIAQAGIIATQDMLSRVSDPNAAGISGWLAEPEGNGVRVTFYADADDGPVAVYRVNILGGRVQGREVFLGAERPALNPIQRRMAAARAAAAGQEHRPCAGDQFNYLVVPPTALDGPIDVYQISPQTRRGHYPMGGHYRTSVAADGAILSSRGFTNACVDTPVAAVPAGGRPEPIALTHLLDPLPTEIHVYLAIWTGHPLVVIAGEPQRMFGVTSEGIGELQP